MKQAPPTIGLESIADLGLTVLETSELPVVACDASGRIRLANSAARRLWGLQDDLSPGTPASSVPWFCRAADDEIDDLLSHMLDGGEPTREWRLVRRPDGAELDVLVCARALGPREEPQGAVMSVLASGREQRRAEQLGNYVGDLEMVVEVSRMLSEVSDPEEAAAMICTVAVGATGAIAMLLWELADGQLVLGHHETALPAGDLKSLSRTARDGARRALGQGGKVIEQLVEGTRGGAGSESFTAWHEPLTSAGRTVGVLSILWCGVLADTERPGALIGSLAHHAAVTFERSELLRRLGDAARTDPLTGLANRRTWQERLEHELARTRRHGQPLSLLLIDIDHFKRYNDRNGHPEGDRLLQETARAWSRRLRKTDLLARIGGEEFAVLLPGCSAENLIGVADGLRGSMPGGQTCSLGAVSTDGSASASELYAAADAALYMAKRAGRDRVEAAEPIVRF